MNTYGIDRYNRIMTSEHGGRTAAMRAYIKLGTNDLKRNVKVQDIAIGICHERTMTARLAHLDLSVIVYSITDAEQAFLRHFV